MGAWSELDTKVNVSLDTSELEDLIQILGEDPIFAPAVEIAERYKKGLEDGSKLGARKIAETNKSLQELAIATNATFTNAGGGLLRSIEIQEESDTSFIIGTNITHFYPLCVEKGRGEVRPIKAKALHWFTLSGDEVFSQYSSPAPPRPFVKPAYEETTNRAVDIVKEAIFDATQ
ncbi:hypothetical protein [uncultured Methanobrevibacter sp.]|uniref:hypothetical protein n=1 Tax=uncultured Methanobrevibacter sp. TaxID=253161 RepID=UPI0025E38879|nr:hypothetical protein [uncultured Methanobrevibacter sp.]